MTENDPARANLTEPPKSDKPGTDLALFARDLLAGTLLGLDPGSRTIGVAASDATRRIASPVETIRRGKWSDDLARLKRIAEARDAVGIVLGLPVNLDGSEGPRAQSARQMAKNLQRGLGLPVLLWDESLTTVAADEAMAEAGLSAAKRHERIDRAAAAVILQGVLDALSRLR